MLLRIAVSTTLCALLALLAAFLERNDSPASRRAAALSGERWYQLSLGEQHFGYWRTRTRRDRSGRWHFDSEQRFAMEHGDPVTIRVSRVFDVEPPHALVRASYDHERRAGAERVRIEGTPGAYEATVTQDNAGARHRELGWTYTLAEYLAFESWLHLDRPPPGATRTVATLDFDRLAVVHRVFDVVDRNATGYVIEKAAPLDATRIQLDHQFAPVHMSVAGLFDLTLAERSAALAPRSTLHMASYFVPADRRIANHTRTSRLVLGLDSGEPASALFADAERGEHGWQLISTANPVITRGQEARYLENTRHFPAAHPDIVALATRAVGDADSADDRARRLTAFVHNHLGYRPGLPPQPVLGVLSSRAGDCTEFADLLTSLARSIGLPARTVFGLVYAERDQPSFAFHAWNELAVDGRWQAFDPTWNQTRVDATHIPLPLDEGAALKLLTGSAELRFRVLEVEYAED